MLIGEHGDLSQAQIEQAAKDAAEAKRIRSLSNKNLAGEIRREMRKSTTPGVSFAVGLVALIALGEPYDNGQQWYCQRTGPNRPKVGRRKKKQEMKPLSAKAAA